VGRVDLTVEASRCGVSENAFGPLTLAAFRGSGAEALSGGIFFALGRVSYEFLALHCHFVLALMGNRLAQVDHGQQREYDGLDHRNKQVQTQEHRWNGDGDE
jgi:hypothetical protein